MAASTHPAEGFQVPRSKASSTVGQEAPHGDGPATYMADPSPLHAEIAHKTAVLALLTHDITLEGKGFCKLRDGADAASTLSRVHCLCLPPPAVPPFSAQPGLASLQWIRMTVETWQQKSDGRGQRSLLKRVSYAVPESPSAMSSGPSAAFAGALMWTATTGILARLSKQTHRMTSVCPESCN